MNSDTIYHLTQMLDSVRSESIDIIKEILDNAKVTSFNLQDVGTGDYPSIKNGDEYIALATVSKDEEGNLVFEFDGEFDSFTKDEGDLYADDLLEIATWFDNNGDDIVYVSHDYDEN